MGNTHDYKWREQIEKLTEGPKHMFDKIQGVGMHVFKT